MADHKQGRFVVPLDRVDEFRDQFPGATVEGREGHRGLPEFHGEPVFVSELPAEHDYTDDSVRYDRWNDHYHVWEYTISGVIWREFPWLFWCAARADSAERFVAEVNWESWVEIGVISYPGTLHGRPTIYSVKRPGWPERTRSERLAMAKRGELFIQTEIERGACLHA